MNLEQYNYAYAKGEARARASIASQRGNTRGFAPDDQQRIHTDGLAAAAEYLVALHTGRPWRTENNLCPDGGVDVGDDIDVKHTTNPSGRLIVQKRDDANKKFVLVIGSGYPLLIVGWCYGHEAQQDCNWWQHVRHPAYFVRPQRSIDDLKVADPALHS